MSDTRFLQLGSEVERAVLTAGLPDYQLAHGAALLADPNRFQLVGPHATDHEYGRHPVFGASIVSLSSRGEFTFRTASFGVDDAGFASRMDAIGIDGILGLRSDKVRSYQSLLTSEIAGMGLFDKINEGGRCTLGGIVIAGTGTETPTKLAVLPFASEALLSFLTETSEKRPAGVGRHVLRTFSRSARESHAKNLEKGLDPRELESFGNVAIRLSNAKKRPDGPVLVTDAFLGHV